MKNPIHATAARQHSAPLMRGKRAYRVGISLAGFLAVGAMFFCPAGVSVAGLMALFALLIRNGHEADCEELRREIDELKHEPVACKTEAATL